MFLNRGAPPRATRGRVAASRRGPLPRPNNWLHTRGTAGGHHDHRSSDRPLAAGRPGGREVRGSGNAETISSSSLWAASSTKAPRAGFLRTAGHMVGRATRTLGTDRRQPGGWIYNVLPYIEQQAVHDMGAGLPRDDKAAANLLRLSIPLRLVYCPARRSVAAYPWIGCYSGWQMVNTTTVPTVVCRSDYAANGGDTIAGCSGFGYIALWKSWKNNTGAGPASLADGGVNGTADQTATAAATFAQVDRRATGVVFCGSLVRPREHHGRDEQYVSCRREIRRPRFLYDRPAVAVWRGGVFFRVQRRLRGRVLLVPVLAPEAGRGRLFYELPFWKRSRGRLQYGLLRWLGPLDKLLDRLPNPPALGQSPRRADH